MAGVPEGNLTLSIPKVHLRRGGPERHRMVPRVAQQARLGGIVIYSGCWGHLFSLASVLGMGKKWDATCGLV